MYRQTRAVNVPRKRLTVAGALLLAFLVLCYAALHWVIRSEGFRTRLQSELNKRTGYEVRIDDLRLSPWLSFDASGFIVSKNGAVLFQGKRIACFLSPFDLFYGRISRLSLESPRLHLSLQDIFSPSDKSSPNLTIGTLNIDDGGIVLETGHGEPVALRSIFVNARNVSLGGDIGLQLRTYVPAVNGTVALSISGGAAEKQAKIAVEQAEEKSPVRLLPKMGAEKTVLEARFDIKKKENGVYEVKGSGRADEFRLGPERIKGQFDSQFALDAKLKSLLFSLDLKMPHFPAKLLPVEIPLNPGPVSATLGGDYAAARNILTLRKISAASGIGVLAGGGAVALGEKPARLTAGFRLREIALDSLKPLMPEPLRAFTYTGKLAADLNLSGAYDDPMVTGLAWNDGAKVAGENISLTQLSSKIPFQWARSSLHVKAGRFQVKDLVVGRKGETQFKVQEASLAGDVVKEPLKPLGMTAEFQILEGRFAATDESKMGEHLNVKGRLTCQDCTGDAVFKGEARVESLELLWNKFFGDFKDQKPVIEVGGNYRREGDDLRLDQLRVSLASVGHLDLRGSVQHLLAKPEFSLEIRTDNLLPAGFYNFFIRDTFKANHPILGQIGVAGKSSLAIRTQGSLEAFTVEGKLNLQQGEIQERSGSWRVGPVALDLPLKVRFPRAANENPGEATPVGKLSVREIKAASTTIPEISAPVILWNNSLRFPEPIRISLFGGRGMIEKLAWKDVINAPADLSFSLGLDDLRLLELTEALGWHRFGGSLSGSIPEVHWTGDSLKSEGAITLNMFGGRVAIRGMEIEQPLSPVRSIKMNARVEGLDLEQASETFEFGRISGVLAGTIEDLVFSQGQPAEFRAGIQTVDTPGVSQWISVEALNKITVLSSGNEAGSIYGGIAGFFDFFRYSKLGFKAALKNDKMILRGVETRNGQEYLVVGTLLPPTVNIVSHTQEIGFRELLRRLERVQKSGSSKSSARP